ncbi:unnamed protein product [Protopolystoma xenopodis]|uniref:Uncharacterized protein n=1 Tax=Protopolystoma xenopodis TaxID=117903 RepID=A0A3S5B0Y7_9PLAT|nr:unnamed protein product [Protopolystoma xenopodis]
MLASHIFGFMPTFGVVLVMAAIASVRRALQPGDNVDIDGSQSEGIS